MPFDLHITDGALRVNWHGIITRDDLRQMAQAFAQAVAGPDAIPRWMTDFSSAETFDVDFASVSGFASTIRTLPLNLPVKSAIVASRPLQFGFARMYQTLQNKPNVVVQFFPDSDSAWAWLKAENQGRKNGGQDRGRR